MNQQWNLSPGHIIRAEVQYSDSEKTKSRFPVVVSNSTFNQKYPEIIVAFTTSSSNVKHPRSYDVVISERYSQFSRTGLPHSTTVRCGRLWTIDKHKIPDIIGIIPDDLMKDVTKLVSESFADSAE